MTDNKRITKIRQWTTFFMVALILSGLTAIPLKTELDLLSNLIDVLAPTNVIETWFALVWEGVTVSTQNYPFFYRCA